MVMATNNVTSKWAWAETASAPPDVAAILQTDSEQVTEELKFLQEEPVSIAIAHEQPISEASSTMLFSRQLQSKTNGNLPVARTSKDRTSGRRDPFRFSEICKRKQYSASPIKKCSVKKVLKKEGAEKAVS